MGNRGSVRSALLRRLLPSPVAARQWEYSILMSADDDPSAPTERLLTLGLEAARRAQAISLDDLSDRIKDGPRWPDIWPGEHYRLLAGLVETLRPSQVIEIGTAAGLSALAMAARMPDEAQMVTFDLIADPATVLIDEDFRSGRIVQHLQNLSDPEVVEQHRQSLERASLIFIDAAKSGDEERRFLDNLRSLNYAEPPIVVFDDIRQWRMLEFWRRIELPKLDLTSFGHWSGTGLVELTDRPQR